MAGINVASLTAEFIGTFILIFTVGCNVLSSNPVWGGVSIACVLTVMIYALGKSSGGNFNPAVSVSLGLTGKMEWAEVAIYCVTQIVAGIVAGLCYLRCSGRPSTCSQPRATAGGRQDLLRHFTRSCFASSC